MFSRTSGFFFKYHLTFRQGDNIYNDMKNFKQLGWYFIKQKISFKNVNNVIFL